MSRSGYTEDGDEWSLIRWRGAVASAIRGRRGQAFLREVLTALEALPEKKLVSNSLKTEEGAVCTLGAVGVARDKDMSGLDPEDYLSVAQFFEIPHALACEIMYENDEGYWGETDEQRWGRMRAWLISLIKG